MNNITLYRNGSLIFNLIEKGKRSVETASLNRVLLSDDSVSIKLNSISVLDIRINDYFILFGSVYRINILPSIDKKSNSQYEYNITAQGLMFDLLRCKYFNADATGFGPDLEFPLIGNIETFLIALRNNMKRFASNWEIGTFTNGETKTLTFGDDTCLSALQKICSEFKTDFWIKVEGDKFVIHTGNYGNTIPIQFEYGKGKGLYSLSRANVDDNDIVNRLYVFGGSNNIPNEYRNFSTKLKLPNADYIEDQASIISFGLKEGSITFDDIYPHRTGKITALGGTKFKFIDNTMDFDLKAKNTDGSTKYLIAGTSAKVHFNTGNLAGYEFEIKSGGYDHVSKTFEIIPFKNDQGQSFPDEAATAFQFAVGDEYVILDIVMPESYISAAENELLQKGLEQFDLHKNAKVSYSMELDPEYMRKIGFGKFDIGDYIRIVDEPLGINKVLRVNQETIDFIQDGEWNVNRSKIVIADSYEISYSSQLILDIKEIKNVMSITNLGQINYSKLGLKTTQELQNLVFDTDDYFKPENIRPNSIETNMLTVGAKSQQISCSVVFFVMFENNKNKIKVNPGIVYSQTMDKEWSIPENIETIPDDDYRYVYAACSKTGTTGTIVFTKDQIKFDSDPNDFYFLIGILHSVVDGVRVLSITVGTTTINGGLIRTGTISSLDMQTYFNLDTGAIKGKIKFLNGSDGFTSIDGGLLMSEIIEVGNDTERNAFISSVTDAGPESIRFGAGADYAHKNDAAFKVLQNGKMIAENAEIEGVIKATEGYIGGPDGWQITTNRLTSTTGKIQFGVFDSLGNFTSGISIAQNNYVSPSTFRNSFMITSMKSEGNINNIAADISSSGNNANNTALRLGASGGSADNALEIYSGEIVIGSQTGKSTIITYKDSLGNNKAMQFEKGILVQYT
ncbi:phage tail protein [Chryseobacterium sp. SSA4.19]|uniref:phage tail protein n=1 Tax=Chryseobacterium sp. SSA4.19 TaxID=2919915 RepID=UPI001F4E53F3|nr:phage tail protein [Chryseobacterium sp. SSA4.19]MCJ8153255.1 phage tail protein [Chryseobacterium sp. SSA4.19]